MDACAMIARCHRRQHPECYGGREVRVPVLPERLHTQIDEAGPEGTYVSPPPLTPMQRAAFRTGVTGSADAQAYNRRLRPRAGA